MTSPYKKGARGSDFSVYPSHLDNAKLSTKV